MDDSRDGEHADAHEDAGKMTDLEPRFDRDWGGEVEKGMSNRLQDRISVVSPPEYRVDQQHQLWLI